MWRSSSISLGKAVVELMWDHCSTQQQQQSQLTSAGRCLIMLSALAAQQGLERNEREETSDIAVELK